MPSQSSPEFKIGSLTLPVFLPSLLFGIGEGGLLPLIPSSAQSLGADLPTAGIITGLVMMGTLFADLPAAKLINRLGERRSMIAASITASLGVLLSLTATNLYVLGLGIFIMGATVAVFSFARHSFLTEAVPFSHRARSLSILGGVFRAGHFIGPLLGALLVTLFGIQSVFWNAAIFCSLAALLLLIQKPERMKNTPLSNKISTWLVAKQESRKLVTLGVASAIMGGLRTARIVGLPLWALHLGIPPATTALYIGIAGALDLALSYSSGQIMDRFGRRWAAVPTAIGLSLTFLLLTLADDGTTFLTIALLMSLANGIGSGIILVIGSDLAPKKNKNEFLASYRLLVDGGVAATPLMIAGLTALSGIGSAMIAVAGFGLLSAFLYNRYLPRRAKPSEQIFPVSDIE
jgi:MFS family permease